MRGRLRILAAALLLPAVASAQVTTGSPFGGSSGGAFNGGDVTGQSNFCGPKSNTNVEIGSCANDANAGTGGTSVVIGNSANNSGNGANTVLIGSGATSSGGSSKVIIGQGALGSGTSTIAIGPSADTGANNNAIAIGSSAAAGGNPSLAMGVSVSAGVNQAVFGGASFQINDVYFARGATSTAATGWTLHGTGGSGADNAGGDITIMAGLGTGTAAGSQVNLDRPLMRATSSTAQTSSNGYTVCESKTLSNTTGTATALATVAAASNSAGGFRITATVTCTNGTEFAASTTTSFQSYANKAGTISFGTATTQTEANGASTGATINCTVAPTWVANGNTVDIKVTPVITGSPTTTTGYINVENLGTGAVTCN